MDTKKCKHCHEANRANAHFCSNCGKKFVPPITADISLISAKYRKPYGRWKVTTEGDVEGRTTTHLGTYTGFIDEIAQKLASKCYYSLQFDPAPRLPSKPAKKIATVSVTLGVASETWNMTPEARAAHVAAIFENRPVEVLPGRYYASFVLRFKEDNHERHS